MNKSDSIKKLAIVGGGPRGLSTLEAVLEKLSNKKDVKPIEIILFESQEHPGAGRVYNLKQPDSNWLNVSERALKLEGRNEIEFEGVQFPSFPSFQEWIGYDEDTGSSSAPDNYPLRSILGKYLNERYRSLASLLKSKGLLYVVQAEVLKVDWEDSVFKIQVDSGKIYTSNELILTIGHQPTKLSKQLFDWKGFSDDHSLVSLFTNAYPVSDFLNFEQLNSNSIVGLRGFGLAMIDVMRALTIGQDGEFKILDPTTLQMIYVKSGKEPKKIVPFSLDGLPLAPKPLNRQIDELFYPTEEELLTFECNVKTVAEQGNASSMQFVLNAIAPVICRVYRELGSKAYTMALDDERIIDASIAWLKDADFAHYLIVPVVNTAQKTMKMFVNMATGKESISLDYCIGQVWGHCEPSLYKAVSFANLNDTIIAEIISLDERLKRYSYGPPVKSLQQMLALIDANIITLDYIKNPKIETTREGWKLSSDGHSITANIMINSVLDPARLLEMNSPIVKHLLHESLVEPVHSDLGIKTGKNAIVKVSGEGTMIPLAAMGRLSKGTIVGVDAVMECFGDRAALWAEGFVERL
ncbi:MAG: FAD/NAD(P)-binding protein [Pricia sp.]